MSCVRKKVFQLGKGMVDKGRGERRPRTVWQLDDETGLAIAGYGHLIVAYFQEKA